MSTVARATAIVALFVIVAVVAPEAAKPIINGADVLVVLAPFVFLAIVRPRRHQTPAGDHASPNASASPSAESPAGSHH